MQYTSSRDKHSLHTCCTGVAAPATCLRPIVVLSCSRIHIDMQPVTCMNARYDVVGSRSLALRTAGWAGRGWAGVRAGRYIPTSVYGQCMDCVWRDIPPRRGMSFPSSGHWDRSIPVMEDIWTYLLVWWRKYSIIEDFMGAAFQKEKIRVGVEFQRHGEQVPSATSTGYYRRRGR